MIMNFNKTPQLRASSLVILRCGLMRIGLILLGFLVGFVGPKAFGDDWDRMQSIVPKGYVCYRAESDVTVDGKLTDTPWSDAPWTTAFVDIEGPAKPKPRYRTRAKMLWDARYFYIGAVLDEPHVWGTLAKHDSVIFQDNDFEVFIDPNGDNHEYYEFEINALNTGWDLFLPKPYMDGGRADNDWEIPGLQTAVHVQGSLNDPADTDKYWSVEIAIPWRVMAEYSHTPTPPRNGDQWRVNFSRVEWQHEIKENKYSKISGLREDNWVWSAQGIVNMHRPERWGFVQFSDGAAGSVEIIPNANLPVRDALMTVYHRQQTFRKGHGRWATSLDELDTDSIASEFPSLMLKETTNGFQGSITVEDRSTGTVHWNVRQDSKLWFDRVSNAER